MGACFFEVSKLELWDTLLPLGGEGCLDRKLLQRKNMKPFRQPQVSPWIQPYLKRVT